MDRTFDTARSASCDSNIGKIPLTITKVSALHLHVTQGLRRVFFHSTSSLRSSGVSPCARENFMATRTVPSSTPTRSFLRRSCSELLWSSSSSVLAPRRRKIRYTIGPSALRGPAAGGKIPSGPELGSTFRGPPWSCCWKRSSGRACSWPARCCASPWSYSTPA